MRLEDFGKVEYLKQYLERLLVQRAMYQNKHPRYQPFSFQGYPATPYLPISVCLEGTGSDSTVNLEGEASESIRVIILSHLHIELERTYKELETLGVQSLDWLPNELRPRGENQTSQTLQGQTLPCKSTS